MIRTFLIVWAFLMPALTFSQSEDSETIRLLYEGNNYDKIISKYSSKAEVLDAKAVFYIGLAYFDKEDDKNAVSMFNLSITKDPKCSDCHFYLGLVSVYSSDFQTAFKHIDDAIAIDSNMAKYYTIKGDVYTELNLFEDALKMFQRAIKTPESSDRAYSQIAQVYLAMNDNEKALDALHTARKMMNKSSAEYNNVLFNTGLLELLKSNYDVALSLYEEFISLYPEDYHAYSKIIQCYYGKKEYDKADPYRKKLYEAHEKELLPDNMKSMFCFDQFDYKGQRVQVFEKFYEKEGELYYKHLFYLTDAEGNIVSRVQTENSPIAFELNGLKYAIGMDQNNTHSTFGFIEENFNYDDLKKVVISIWDGNLKAAASSTVGGKSGDDDKKKKKKK